jgi:Protein of unknown function (DUF3455)
LATAAFTLLFAASLQAAEPPAPEDQVVLFRLHAERFQVYECIPKKDDPTTLQWSFKGPEAILTDDKGDKVGKHNAGPAWEASNGSKVIANNTHVDKTPKPPAVPWLLLKAVSHEGDGKLSKVTYIRRDDTEGGTAPDAPDAAYKGDELRVPYKATYIFYGAKQD